MAYHRHTFAIRPISEETAETVQLEYKLRHGPFAYCPICKCVPTEFMAKDDDPVIFEGVGGFYL